VLLGCFVVGTAGATQKAPEPDLSGVPGVVLNHSPASTGVYLGAPSIAILPDGRYVASHPFTGRATGLARDHTAAFASDSNLITFHRVRGFRSE